MKYWRARRFIHIEDPRAKGSLTFCGLVIKPHNLDGSWYEETEERFKQARDQKKPGTSMLPLCKCHKCAVRAVRASRNFPHGYLQTTLSFNRGKTT